MRHAYDPAGQSNPAHGQRQTFPGLVAGTVAVTVGGILGLGAIVYHFSAPDAAEQTTAAAEAGADDSTDPAPETAGPAAPADPGADVTEDVAVPGATTTGATLTGTAKAGPTKAGPMPTTAAQQGITSGAFCSPAGATGTTPAGLTMRCTRAAGESQARWRAGPAATTRPATTKPATRPATAAPTTKPATAPSTAPTTPAATRPTTTAPPVTETSTAAPPAAGG
ncbi:hypothetical protein GCM10010172_76360 [Paractinoplanes ferrugineus]|uniref:Uncharacterized protein n=1 Tax=Paractinoplanes ferrugineus TaxID=113564 RepID=A0A919JB41_9ACTN|nr:hypothetical protein [Actinoplanes ferrugineus]GIE16393.1 hypothetical protein Afe05nite_82330 [Actinoplanes ferrugineus]